MKILLKSFLIAILCLFVFVTTAQNPAGIWKSNSGGSFKVVNTTKGIKYYNLAGGNWIYADYIGNSQYQAYFYNKNVLTDILTFTLWDNNNIQATYYNGTSYYWKRKTSTTKSS